MSALRVSTPMGYLRGTCEILPSRVLILVHALAFLTNQQLRCYVSQSVPHQCWLLRVHNRVYDHMDCAELGTMGEELDSPRHLMDAKEPYENPVSYGERRIAEPKDWRLKERLMSFAIAQWLGTVVYQVER